jgi:hypothetical protein
VEILYPQLSVTRADNNTVCVIGQSFQEILQPPPAPKKTVEHRRVIRKAPNSKFIVLKGACLKIGRIQIKRTRKISKQN